MEAKEPSFVRRRNDILPSGRVQSQHSGIGRPLVGDLDIGIRSGEIVWKQGDAVFRTLCRWIKDSVKTGIQQQAAEHLGIGWNFQRSAIGDTARITTIDYPSTSNPFRSTRFNSFNEGPLGFFSPRSHFCTVEGLVFR